MEILAGNELLSGAAVYFSPSGEWVEALAQARLFGTDEVEARDAVIKASKATLQIVGIEIEKVAVIDGAIVPERLRERIRAKGPTTSGFDRQHLGEDGHVSI
ncbi:MAG TPA: DUF2849 domain-containing protein [Devosiaceae bacterium]|jgi:hypothetical protein